MTRNTGPHQKFCAQLQGFRANATSFVRTYMLTPNFWHPTKQECKKGISIYFMFILTFQNRQQNAKHLQKKSIFPRQFFDTKAWKMLSGLLWRQWSYLFVKRPGGKPSLMEPNIFSSWDLKIKWYVTHVKIGYYELISGVIWTFTEPKISRLLFSIKNPKNMML